MTANVGTIDRVLRLALGIGLFYIAFFSGLPDLGAPLLKYAAATIGVIMLLTSGLRICPIYSLLGIKTCRAC